MSRPSIPVPEESRKDLPAVYFGYRLTRVASPRATGWHEEDRHLADYLARHADLLAAIVRQPPMEAVYDLRFTASPAAAPGAEATVSAFLLGRLPASRADELQALERGLLNLLLAALPELDFEPLGAEQIGRAREPFPIRHVSGIRRRCLLVNLDTVSFGAVESRSRPVGFGATSPLPPLPPRASTAVPLFYVCAFRPELRRHDAVLQILLGEPGGVSVSVRLAATSLRVAESALLEQQIGACERYARAGLAKAPAALDVLAPTLQAQARAYQEHQERLLFGLRPGAAEVTIEVASERPLSALTLEAIGGLFSAPAGGSEPFATDAWRGYLVGGFETCDPSPGACERYATLDVDLPSVAGAPPGAERLPYLFDPREAAAVFRFPAPTDLLPAGIEVRGWRLQPAPARLPRTGVVLGKSLDRTAAGQLVRLAGEDRMRHVYSIGQTGTGKSSLLRSMVLSDIEAGEGVCLIDPHGDLYGEILENIPERRWDDVVLLDPTDSEHPVGLNLLEYDAPDQRHFIVQELLGILQRLLAGEHGTSMAELSSGPMFFQHVRMNLLLAMSRPSDPGTLLEFHAIFQDPDYWQRWTPLEVADPQLHMWVQNVLARADYQRPGSEGGSMGSYVSSKFDPFVFDPMLRLIFAQKRSTIRLGPIMDEGKILLVNLAKGLMTELNARFLGMVLLAKLQAAAMARARRPRRERRPFYLYVDEFQSLATSSFVSLLSEARKFGLGMILANQFLTQVADAQIVSSILGNAGTLICFRLGQPDAVAMEARLAPAFSAFDLQNLPNFHACVATLAGGELLRPFSMRTLYRGVDTPEGPRTRAAVLARSRDRYGRPRAGVEEELARSFKKAPSTD